MRIKYGQCERRLKRFVCRVAASRLTTFGLSLALALLGVMVRVWPTSTPLWSWGIWSFAAIQFSKDFLKEYKTNRRIQNDDFFQKYIKHVTNGVDMMRDVDDYTRETAGFLQDETLKKICEVMSTYYKQDDTEKKRAKYNASLMVAVDCDCWIDTDTRRFKSAVQFFDDNRRASRCQKILHLTRWAYTPEGWTDFALPVDNDEDYLLPGAPRAYDKGEIEIISDTLNKAKIEKDMPKHAAKATRELLDYFELHKKRFRSFFSIPLFNEEQKVGVLNVQSMEPDILGIDEEHRKDLALCLEPFCAILAALIVREATGTNGALNVGGVPNGASDG